MLLTARAFALATILCVVAGCKDKPEVTEPAAPTVTSAAASAPALAPPPPSQPPEPEAPSLASLFEGEPTVGTRRSETVTGAGGVYAGLPPDWRTSDVYNQYLIAEGKEAKAMAYLVIGGVVGQKELEAFAKGAAYPIFLKDLEWDGEWTEVAVGSSEYRALARRGHGRSITSATKRREAIAIGVEVPGRRVIHILGSWDGPSPAAERQFADLIRGIGRCKHKPNRGCVPVQPAGQEDELPEAPEAGPGSSPFG